MLKEYFVNFSIGQKSLRNHSFHDFVALGRINQKMGFNWYEISFGVELKEKMFIESYQNSDVFKKNIFLSTDFVV